MTITPVVLGVQNLFSDNECERLINWQGYMLLSGISRS